MFTTIARDLADCDITMRGALACAVHDDNELKHAIDISRQWQELFVGPIGEASKAITAPVLLVIDALDESGDMNTREILGLLSGNTMRFPSGYGDMTDMWYIQGITNTCSGREHLLVTLLAGRKECPSLGRTTRLFGYGIWRHVKHLVSHFKGIRTRFGVSQSHSM
jgi:hypothetical protein